MLREDVLLVADVLAQHLDEPVEQRLACLGVLQLLQRDDELVDLLVLLLDLEGDRLAVGEDPPGHRPQQRLLGEGVREHQPVELGEDLGLLVAGGGAELVQQLIEADVVTLLADQDAHRAAERGFVLVGEGRHGFS